MNNRFRNFRIMRRGPLAVLLALLCASPLCRGQLPTPTVVVSANPNPVSYGSSLTLTAAVTGTDIPTTGTVQFYYDEGIALGTPVGLVPGVPTSTVQLITTGLPVGTQTVYAVYSGDANYNPATSSPLLQVTVNPAAFTLTLTSSAATVNAGAMVEFDVQAGGTAFPTGQNIAFTGIPTPAAAPTLNNTGLAVYRFGLFSPGQYTIQAQYGGGPNFAAENSNTITLTVTATPVTVTLASSANPVTYPGAFNLTGTTSSGGYGIPAGTASFQNGSTVLGNGTLAVVNGASGFSATPTSTFDPAPANFSNIAVATGDFNGDGNPDLAVLQSDDDGDVTMLVSLGNGDGTFAAPVTYTMDDEVDQNAIALVTGDFNKDGYSDLAILGSDGLLTVFLATANGSGNLQESQLIELSEGGQAIAAGDFNGDGNLDIAVASATFVSVFLGAGAGGGAVFPATPSFQYLAYPNTLSPSGMAAADFNKDGFSDLAISNTQGINGPNITVLLYNSDIGNFTAQTYAAGESASAIAAGDFNGDTYPDIAVVSSGDSTAGILLNNQNGGFQALISYATATEPVAIVAGDFNADGYTDFAIAGEGGDAGGGTSILFGGPITSAANATLSGETLILAAYGQALVSADFNKDGNPDLGVALGNVTSYVNSSAQFGIDNVALPGGTYPLTATYTPADGSTFAAATGTLNQLVSPAVATIVLAPVNPTTYGQSVTLNATVAGVTAGVTPTGSVQFLMDGTPVGTGAVSPAGAATYTIAGGGVTAGTHLVTALYSGDGNYNAIASGAGTLLVAQATSVVTWINPAPISAGTPLSAAQLDATAVPLRGTFTYTPGAGTVLAVGTQTLSVTFTPTDAVDYNAATASVTIVVTGSGLSLTAINPSSGYLGASATTVTLTGTGFVASSIAQWNGSALSTIFVSATQLQAIIPTSDFLHAQTGTITVINPGGAPTNPGLAFSVTTPPVQVVLSGPPTAPPATQPTITFQLPTAYPVPITGTFTLVVQPVTTGGPIDPAVQFSTGGDAFNFTLPANTTTTPTVQLQSGTVSAAITVSLTLTAGGVDITPASLQPVVIQVPPSAPTITSFTLARSGDTLTATIQGYSNTREVKTANFAFTAASGSTINNPGVTVNVDPAFVTWYGQPASDPLGSTFMYVQTFVLTGGDAATIGSATVSLVNTIGTSNSASAH